MDVVENLRNSIKIRDERRSQILDIEKELLKMDQVEIPPKHHFSEGLYGREITIPSGTVVVGKIHKHQSLNILAQGEMTLITEEGIKKIKAPYTVVSKPGIKRLAYTHSECTWICVHATEETDLEKIEDQVIAKSYDDLPEITTKERKILEELQSEDLCLG